MWEQLNRHTFFQRQVLVELYENGIVVWKHGASWFLTIKVVLMSWCSEKRTEECWTASWCTILYTRDCLCAHRSLLAMEKTEDRRRAVAHVISLMEVPKQGFYFYFILHFLELDNFEVQRLLFFSCESMSLL